MLTSCLLLVLFLCVLILSNYSNQKALHSSAIEQFRLDTEKRAAALGYFFSERKFDLRSLASSLEIATYFNNKALGMSEEYGLRVNLFIIRRLLEGTLKEKVVQSDSIYQRFVLIDIAGNTLVDTSPSAGTKITGDATILSAISREREPKISFISDSESIRVQIVSPCVHKNQLKGYLIAIVKTDTLFHNFIDSNMRPTAQGFELMAEDGKVIYSAGHNHRYLDQALTPERFEALKTEDHLLLNLSTGPDTPKEVLLTSIPIHNLPLFLLAWVDASTYAGFSAFWHLVLGTGSLAIVIMLGVVVLVRFNTQNALLKQQYTASQRQQELLEKKNLQLNEAIKGRQEVEQQLENQRTLQMRSDRLRSLGEMAAGIAHELNQPLAGVRGLAELDIMRMERDPEFPKEKLKASLTTIIEQSDRMVHIIDHVRLFARESGKVKTSIVDLNEVVLSALGLLSAQFKSYGLYLEKNLSPEELAVCVNPYSVEEVLLNLLNNARDAVLKKSQERQSSDFRPVVKISTGLKPGAENELAWLLVEDNGDGVPDTIIEKIFDPFYTTKDPDKGTGLGLSICKSIVEQFAGQIRFEPAARIGATFVVEFPIHRA